MLLISVYPTTAGSGLSQPTPIEKDKLNGGQTQSSPQLMAGHRRIYAAARQKPSRPPPRACWTSTPPAHFAINSAAELNGIGSAEDAATWAHRVLRAKGTLVAADAKHIEDSFQQKLVEFERANVAGRRGRARSRNVSSTK